MRTPLRNSLCAILSLIALRGAWSADLRVLPAGQLPKDARLEPLKDENGYFPFTPPKTREAWQQRAEQVRRQILVPPGLWPMPAKTPSHAVIHGRVDRPDTPSKRSISKAIPAICHRQSVSAERAKRPAARRLVPARPLGQRPLPRRRREGNPQATRPRRRAIRTRRPQHPPGPLRAVGPHGLRRLPVRHGRLCRQPATAASPEWQPKWKRPIAGASSARRPKPGCKRSWGCRPTTRFARWTSSAACRTSIRSRIGITGASGGGDADVHPVRHRSAPGGRLSGRDGLDRHARGLHVRKRPLLRIDTGNVEFAGLFAPKPLGMTGADDWTRRWPTRDFPN